MGGIKKRKMLPEVPKFSRSRERGTVLAPPAKVSVPGAMTTASTSPMSGNRFLRIEEVMRQTALPRSTIYYKIKRQEFPAPVRLTARISAWEAASVELWVQSRIAESLAGAPGK